ILVCLDDATPPQGCTAIEPVGSDIVRLGSYRGGKARLQYSALIESVDQKKVRNLAKQAVPQWLVGDGEGSAANGTISIFPEGRHAFGSVWLEFEVVVQITGHCNIGRKRSHAGIALPCQRGRIFAHIGDRQIGIL